MIIIYINNFLVFKLDKSKIDKIKQWLNIYYKMKDLKTCYQFLSIKIEKNEIITLYFFHK